MMHFLVRMKGQLCLRNVLNCVLIALGGSMERCDKQLYGEIWLRVQKLLYKQQALFWMQILQRALYTVSWKRGWSKDCFYTTAVTYQQRHDTTNNNGIQRDSHVVHFKARCGWEDGRTFPNSNHLLHLSALCQNRPQSKNVTSILL